MEKEKGISVGEFLRLERLNQGLSLEAISRITRISLHNLQYLENGQYHLLPAEIYTRGYLRSYAKVLRLDPEEIIKAYQNWRSFFKRSKETFNSLPSSL